MFFEFTRGNQLRAINGSRHAADLEERFDSALRNTAKGWRRAVDRHLARLGVSQAGWMTIAEAMHARLPLPQSKLAEKIAISRASMVQTIDRLVRDGLVKRESSATDRREKRIVITDAGTHLYAVIQNEIAAARRRWLGTIEPESLDHLTELLEKLLDQAP
jgi:MarR family transcriptional regulator, transcriptional regulator for hemolysin